LYARDISLDSIYLKKSPLFFQLQNLKFKFYKIAGSSLVDKNVIFAKWINGNQIVFLKEFSSFTELYIFNRKSLRKQRIAFVKGFVSGLWVSASGRYFILKSVFWESLEKLSGLIYIYDSMNKRFFSIKNSSIYNNFFVSLTEDSIYLYKKHSIFLYNLNLKKERIIFSREFLEKVFKRKLKNVVYKPSPNGKYFLLLNGEAGYYQTYISTNYSLFLKGSTSLSEIFWLNNKQIVYRVGGPGFYSVRLKNIKTGKIRVLSSNSFNTNISFSTRSSILSFLNNGLISVYRITSGKISNLLIEGEDCFFSADGSRFITLFNSNLFLSNYYETKKCVVDLTNNIKKLSIVYKKIKSKKLYKNRFSKKYILQKIEFYKSIVK